VRPFFVTRDELGGFGEAEADFDVLAEVGPDGFGQVGEDFDRLPFPFSGDCDVRMRCGFRMRGRQSPLLLGTLVPRLYCIALSGSVIVVPAVGYECS
jgi:hypothetical protein